MKYDGCEYLTRTIAKSRSHDFDCMPVSCNWCIEEFFLNVRNDVEWNERSPCKIDELWMKANTFNFNVAQQCQFSIQLPRSRLIFFFFFLRFTSVSTNVLSEIIRMFYSVQFRFGNCEMNIIFSSPYYPLLDCAGKFIGHEFTGRRYAWRFFERKWIFKSGIYLIFNYPMQTE